jgi:hypothetical protein
MRSENAPCERASKAEPLELILRGVLHLFWHIIGTIIGGASRDNRIIQVSSRPPRGGD